MPDYVFTVRNVSKGEFGNEPARRAMFLEVPSKKSVKTPLPDHKISKRDWIAKVLEDAAGRVNPDTGEPVGDIVIYVHGYNNSTAAMLQRLRNIKRAFAANGFEGSVIGFDWPSADSALNYLEDRWDAKQTANQLVREGIESFVRLQRPDCEINLHLMAHSMGAYVVREALDHADDRRSIASVSWSVSQILLFGADVSASSLGDDNSKSSSLYRHCNRMTNYFNHFDNALSLSNIKRIGVSPRAGRVGLPGDVPRKAVNIDCSDRFEAIADRFKDDPFAGHRWYFQDDEFLADAYHTIMGDTDRESLPTRLALRDRLVLRETPKTATA